MIDFTSALYLGLEHPWADLPAWPRLTLGKPAALGSVPGTGAVERELARLAGCERAILAPSTLHAFHDVFAAAGPRGAILFDEDSYPIARLAAGRRGRPLRNAWGTRPIVVADGFSPFRGSSPPLEAYTAKARESGGLLVVDDTQALGLGAGGGGAVAAQAAGCERVVVVASMAKAFGVPLAFVAGSVNVIGRLELSGFTRVHCSPPSAAVVAAAGRALEINRQSGDSLREKLRANVARLRHGLANLELLGVPGEFPVQPLGNLGESEARALHTILLRNGVRTLLARASAGAPAQLVFVLTARHSWSDIDSALSRLTLWRTPRERSQRRGIWTPKTKCWVSSTATANSKESAAAMSGAGPSAP